MTGFLHAAAHFLTAPFRGARDVAVKAWHAIRAVYQFLLRVVANVGDAWSAMVAGTVSFADALWHLGYSTANAVYHFAHNVIPAAARWALAKAVGVARAAVKALERWTISALRRLERWAQRIVNAAVHLARTLFRAAWRRIATLWHWVYGAGRQIESLVLHPTRLVTWVLPHLAVPLLRWMVRNSEPVVRLLVGLFVKEADQTAHLLEDVLSKMI